VTYGLPVQAGGAKPRSSLRPVLVGLGSGEPGEGPELVPRKPGFCIGLEDLWELPKRMGHPDPLPGGAPSQTVSGRQPTGHGGGTVPLPQLQLVVRGQQAERLSGSGHHHGGRMIQSLGEPIGLCADLEFHGCDSIEWV
jgi:hypothetical protein